MKVEEIAKLHDISLEWGCITNLMDKISDIEDKIDGGWFELIDMVADAITEEGDNKDSVAVFFNLYQFLFRLYYRLKMDSTVRPFNQYSKQDDKYWITNYNYEAFKWAKGIGAMDEVDNLVIKIPTDKLTDKQRRALDRRCK